MSSFISRLITLTVCLGFLSPSLAQTVTWKQRPKWTEATPLASHIIRVKVSGKYGLVRPDGSQIIDCSYDRISEVCDGCCLLLNRKGDNFILGGIMNAGTGGVTGLKETYVVDRYWPYFSEGMLPVKLNGMWGYINAEGKEVIPPKYDEAYPFFFGHAAVKDNDWCAHIDAQDNVSYISTVNNGRKINFTSSFVQSAEWGPVALYAIDRKLFCRDIQGGTIKEIEVSGFDVRELDLHVQGKKYSLDFNDAWQPVKILCNNREVSFKAEPNPQYNPPRVRGISASSREGGFDLCLNGKEFLSGQFESVLPLTDEYILVKSAGLWGILQMHPYDNKVVVRQKVASVPCYHGTGARMTCYVQVPASLSRHSVYLRSIGTEGVTVAPQKLDDSFVVEVPVALNGKELLMEPEVDGIRYIPSPMPINLVFKQGFEVRCITPSAKVKKNQTAKISISVCNTKDMPSKMAVISIAGGARQTIGELAPREKATVVLPYRVDLGDEDSLLRNLKIMVDEEGCPAYSVSQSVRFERDFGN